MSKPVVNDAPGLQWRPRTEGWVAYWIARSDLVKRGYSLKSQRLWPASDAPWRNPGAGDVSYLQSECQRLQDQMLGWARGGNSGHIVMFTGSLNSLIDCYRNDKDSSYQELRFESRNSYDFNLDLIKKTVGARTLSSIKGRDFPRWYKNYAEPQKPNGTRRRARAHAVMTMLRIVFSFGVSILEDRECMRLRMIMAELQFEGGRGRDKVVTAEQAIAIRKTAHEMGSPSIALGTAIGFETILRPKDYLGEYVPVSEPGLSDVHVGHEKWLYGIDWREISPDLILTHRLSKSLRGRSAINDRGAGKVKVYDLKLYPMVMEELALVAVNDRVGPLIKEERTGLPWASETFARRWRKIARAAQVPNDVQLRDSRAGGLSEGIEATGGDLEAGRHAAGHSRLTTTQRYSRQDTKQTASFAVARANKRTPQ